MRPDRRKAVPNHSKKWHEQKALLNSAIHRKKSALVKEGVPEPEKILKRKCIRRLSPKHERILEMLKV